MIEINICPKCGRPLTSPTQTECYSDLKECERAARNITGASHAKKEEGNMKKTKTIKFYNIEWDTEDNGKIHSPEKLGLPKSVTMDVDTGSDVEEEGADLLSDRYGWCVHGFNWKRVYKKRKKR